MANEVTPPWYQGMGDSLGLPAMISGAPWAARKLYQGIRAIGTPASAARYAGGAALGAGLYGMGDGKGNATTATGNEMDLYIRDPATGQMIPNPALHGMDPTQPGVSTLPQSPQAALGPQPGAGLAAAAASAVPGAGASPSPSPLPPGLAAGPNSGMIQSGPLPPASANPAPQQTFSPPPAQPMPQDQPAGQPMQLHPSFYNGPGSQNFGQGGADGYPQQGFLPRLFGGGQPNGNASAQYGGPHAGLISRIMQTLGNTFHSNGGMTSGWHAPTPPASSDQIY